MRVVVASAKDEIAAAAVARWAAGGAGILSCTDLSADGWRYTPGAAGRSMAVIEGRQVPARDIDAVVVRLPYVSPLELGHIAPSDRSYVAAEMTAFLTAWLDDLPCPVVNRPTAGCLAGPAWSESEWRLAATSLDIPIREPRAETRTETVTVVGRTCIGTASAQLQHHARRIADKAAADLLAVEFQDDRFVGAHLWPDISQPMIADALTAHLASLPKSRRR